MYIPKFWNQQNKRRKNVVYVIEKFRQDKALQCDLCDSWIHIKCNFIDSNIYQKLSQSTDSWYCINCTKAILPFSSTTNDQLHIVNTGNTISPTQHDSLNLSPDHNIQNLITELNNLSDNNYHGDNKNENCRY